MQIVLKVIAVATALFLIGCETEPKYATTEIGNFAYEFVQDEPGEKATVGEHATFHIEMTGTDSTGASKTIWSTYVNNGGEPVHLAIPDMRDARSGGPFPEIATLLEMSEGDSAHVWQQLDTMAQKPRGLAEFSRVDYGIRLVKLQDQESYEREEGERRKLAQAKSDTVKEELNDILAKYDQGAYNGELVDLGDGLKKLVIEEGTGATPSVGQTVKANYYGTLPDGTHFDDSFRTGNPFAFPLGQRRVIQGWDSGFAQMKVGERAVLFIPSELGYGAAGSPPRIPADSDLVFLVELVNAI